MTRSDITYTNQKVLAANGTVACLSPTASADVRADIKGHDADNCTTRIGAAAPIFFDAMNVRRQGYRPRLGSGNENRILGENRNRMAT